MYVLESGSKPAFDIASIVFSAFCQSLKEEIAFLT